MTTGIRSAGHALQIERASEPAFRIGFRERFLSVGLDEGLLVRDELVEHSIGDVGLNRLNAIAHPSCAGVVIAIMEDTRCDRLRWVRAKYLIYRYRRSLKVEKNPKSLTNASERLKYAYHRGRGEDQAKLKVPPCQN